LSVDLNLEFNPAIASLITISPEDWQQWFDIWLHDLDTSQTDYEVTLRFTDDPEIQQLNFQYRQQDRHTDVLAFAALEADIPLPQEPIDPEPVYLGDIVISVDTAKHQALANQNSLQWELAWLTTHGLLHLLGWDHPDDLSLEQMLGKQADLMQLTPLGRVGDLIAPAIG